MQDSYHTVQLKKVIRSQHSSQNGGVDISSYALIAAGDTLVQGIYIP